ncbi:hypothetical protein OUZ56_001972 [Daphnia magna]|uniref:Uncharacterized protein n=1 Tax=Daphnia magna TaxID=35525 RepID=A0ABR0A4N5_9CRUS|nr:hypothetical protein OUZ56_001972 [Daphnia magna]
MATGSTIIGKGRFVVRSYGTANTNSDKTNNDPEWDAVTTCHSSQAPTGSQKDDRKIDWESATTFL